MTHPSLPHALAGLTADLDQQQMECVDLLAAMSKDVLECACWRIRGMCSSPGRVTEAVGNMALLGLMQAVVAWQGHKGECER